MSSERFGMPTSAARAAMAAAWAWVTENERWRLSATRTPGLGGAGRGGSRCRRGTASGSNTATSIRTAWTGGLPCGPARRGEYLPGGGGELHHQRPDHQHRVLQMFTETA